uniref:DUF38 domain-containing protein n=1 Tax=Panagrolaimus sp. PS1159 TaxID=55785 RepID=A0AC35FD39_9BILA
MVTLNQDILEEIVSQFNIWAMPCERKAVKALQTFMRSGKESYEAALRYFSHVDTVVIAYNKIRIIVKRHVVIERDEFNLYKFPYDFDLLNDILGVLENTNKKLEIEAYPESPAGRKALARLTQKHLKFVGFDDGDDLPLDYYNFFKNECNFDDSRLNLCCVKNPSISDFFKLTSNHQSLTTHLIKFIREMSFERQTFPAIESLSIDPCFCEEGFEDFPFLFTTGLIDDFTKLIVECMPNLKKLVTDFSSRPEHPSFSWKKVYKEMKKFNSEMFQHIPFQVKGVLRFFFNDFRQSFKKVVENIQKTDPGVDVDLVEKRLVKKFDIHDELYFEFVLQFCEDDDSEDDSDDELTFDYFQELPYAAFFGNDFDQYDEQGGDNEESNGSDYFDGEQDAASADAADPDSY